MVLGGERLTVQGKCSQCAHLGLVIRVRGQLRTRGDDADCTELNDSVVGEGHFIVPFYSAMVQCSNNIILGHRSDVVPYFTTFDVEN